MGAWITAMGSSVGIIGGMTREGGTEEGQRVLDGIHVQACHCQKGAGQIE